MLRRKTTTAAATNPTTSAKSRAELLQQRRDKAAKNAKAGTGYTHTDSNSDMGPNASMSSPSSSASVFSFSSFLPLLRGRKGERNGTGKSHHKNDEKVLKSCTPFMIFGALLVICAGAIIAAFFFNFAYPECMKGIFSFTDNNDNNMAEARMTVSDTSDGGQKLRRMQAIPSTVSTTTMTTINTPANNKENVAMRGTGIDSNEDTNIGKSKNVILNEDENEIILTVSDPAVKNKKGLNGIVASNPVIQFPDQCTKEQMTRIDEQLPPGGCIKAEKRPWKSHVCSFSDATRCSDPTWLRRYYFRYGDDKNNHLDRSDSKSPSKDDPPLTSIHVGCNKGREALQLLQAGIRRQEGTEGKLSSSLDWKIWQRAFAKNAFTSGFKVDGSDEVCPFHDVSSNLLSPSAVSSTKTTTQGNRHARAYCIEPAPATFDLLQKTKMARGLGDELQLSQIVIGNSPGIQNVEKEKTLIGQMAKGVSQWNSACRQKKSNANSQSECMEVKVDSLDNWIATTDIGPNDPIHFLSLGLEGHDFHVLTGAGRTLNRVHYIDFQYNWYGDWGTKELKDMIERLKRKNFVCYWAGNDDNLWRITDCWKDHYTYRYVANIACVNAKLAQDLLQDMEELFAKTLTKTIQFGET